MKEDLATLLQQNRELLAERDRLRVINDALRSKIDERAQALRAETTESQRLRDALDHVPLYIFLKDAQARFVYANQATLDLFGCTHEALIGRTVDDFFPASTAATMRAIDAHVLAGESATTEVVVGEGEARRVYLENKTPVYADATRREIWGLCGISTDITERKRAEDAVRQSEFFFRESQRTGRIGSYRVDFTAGRFRASEVLDEIFGLAPGDEHTVASWLQLIFPDDREMMAHYLQVDVITQGHPFDREYRIVRRSDGAVRWVHGIGALERDPGNAVVAMAGTIRDVTEAHRAEDALRESESRFRTVFNEAPLGVVLSDAITGEMYEVNERFAEIVGRTPEELVGMNWMSITHPDDVQENLAGTTHLAAGTISRLQMPKRYRRPDGSDVWVSMTVAPFVDQGREHRTNVAMVEDISARIVAEEELRKLSRAVQQSPASIVITNVNAEIEYVNEAFLRTSGYSRDEVMGKNPRILHSGKTPNGTYEALWTALTNGDTWSGEFQNRRKDGTEYTELAIISPLRQPDGTITHYVSVKEDITERKRLADELARHRDHLMELVDERTRELVVAREQAEAANQAKSAFLATMSHEIRTPLNGVIAMAEMLALRPLAPHDLDSVKTIERSAHNLLSVIDDILDFSKIEAGRMELEEADMSLREVVADVASSLQPIAAASDVDLAVDVAPGVPEFVRGDATRMRQVVMNLAGNAIKFSRGRVETRGRVSVRVDVASEDPLQVALRVADNGIGMTPETLGRLFTSFTQAETSTTRRFGGTGLGLAITRRLVDLMEGTIDVTSVVGLGSTFTVTIPLKRSDARREAQDDGDSVRGGASMPAAERPVVRVAPPSVADARAQRRLVLVAEDDTMNQKVILQQLALLGYAGEIAGDGAEALRLWRQGGHAMLLSDLHMPTMDGYELVAAIRREEPAGTRLPVIALTANALRGESERATRAGMDGYLTKPVPLLTLRGVLDRWIAVEPDGAESAALLPVHPLQRSGDPVAVRRQIATYLRGARSMVAKLKVAHAGGDLRRIGEHAARLKTSSRAAGALLFGDLCAELENAATMAHEASIDRLLPHFTQAFATVEAELEQRMKSLEGAAPPR